tara:strand:- start:1473 stop:1661 length:189 start_codon:yes stop_codon:yes gene_type:complete
MIKTVTKQYKRDLDNSIVFCSYKMEEDDGKIWTVPLDMANADYQAIQEWAAIDGNNITDPGE